MSDNMRDSREYNDLLKETVKNDLELKIRKRLEEEYQEKLRLESEEKLKLEEEEKLRIEEEERIREQLNTPKPDMEKLDESISIDQVFEYFGWRAMFRTIRDSAKMAGIDEIEAIKIENAEDTASIIQKKRNEISEDPVAAIKAMIPEAIGVLREKMRSGSLVAVQEILKTTKDQSKKEAAKNEDRGPSPTAIERDKLSKTSRSIRSKYRGDYSDNIANTDNGNSESAEEGSETITEPAPTVVKRKPGRPRKSEKV